MSNEELKQQIAEAIISGKMQPTTFVLGDNVKYKVDGVAMGATGIQVTTHNHYYGEGSIPIPKERDYNAVREYIELRKQRDSDFKNFCNNNTRTALCEKLSKEFGWTVDEHSLTINVNRNR